VILIFLSPWLALVKPGAFFIDIPATLACRYLVGESARQAGKVIYREGNCPDANMS